MGMNLSVKTMVDAALKGLTPDAASAKESPGGPVQPSRAADPKAVDAFHQAMAPQNEQVVGKVDIPHDAGLHFPGDLDQASRITDGAGKTEPGAAGSVTPDVPRDKHVTAENYIESVTEILGKPDPSLTDLYRVQVLSSMAKIEVTRNTSITNSLDNALNTVIKSQS